MENIVKTIFDNGTIETLNVGTILYHRTNDKAIDFSNRRSVAYFWADWTSCTRNETGEYVHKFRVITAMSVIRILKVASPPLAHYKSDLETFMINASASFNGWIGPQDASSNLIECALSPNVMKNLEWFEHSQIIRVCFQTFSNPPSRNNDNFTVAIPTYKSTMPSLLESLGSFIASIFNAIGAIFSSIIAIFQSIFGMVYQAFEGLIRFFLSNILAIGILAAAAIGYQFYQQQYARTPAAKKVN